MVQRGCRWHHEHTILRIYHFSEKIPLYSHTTTASFRWWRQNPVGEWTQSWDGYIFLSLNNRDWSVLVYMTDHDIETDKFMYEYTHNILPNMFEYNHQIHSHNTRQRNQLHITNRQTAMAGNIFIYQGSKLDMLNIPNTIKESETTQTCIRKDKQIIQNAY